MHPEPGSFCSLDEVIVALAPSPAAPSPVLEGEAFQRLTDTRAGSTGYATRMVEAAMALTGADSAGLSIEEVDAGEQVFRWVATAGELARYVNGTMPRRFSPCGAAVDYRKALLMREPVRYYAYISQLHVPVCSVLLVPFSRQGRLVGTLWVVAHSEAKRFTAADLAVVARLAGLASDVMDALAVPLRAG